MMSIDISQDLNISVQVISTETATITGVYDTGSPSNTYLPGKDFSATDNISDGVVTTYKLGISLTSKTNQLYAIDTLFLQSLDDPKTNGTGAIPLYLLNADPDASNITDDGLYTVLPGYAANMASVVFGSNAGITSTSTVNLTLHVNYPGGIYWKTKIAPKIQVVAVKDAVQKKSAVFTPPEVKMSSYGTYNTDFLYYPQEWAAITLSHKNGVPGFVVPFHFPASMTTSSALGKLLDTPNVTSINYSANIAYSIDGTAIAISTANVEVDYNGPSGMTLQGYNVSAGKLNITLSGTKPRMDTLPNFTIKVFLPYDPGSKGSVTMTMAGSWQGANNGGVQFNGWKNSYIINETQTGGINASQVIPLIIPPPSPYLRDNLASVGYNRVMTGNLETLGINFLSVPGSQMLLLYDDPNDISQLGNDPNYLSVAYSVNGQVQTPYTPSANEYTQQYAYVALPAGYDPTAIARLVFSGAVPLGSYQAIVDAGHTPNVLMTTLLTDLLAELNVDLNKALTITIGKPNTDTISNTEFLARYQASPTTNFKSMIYVAMRVGTNLSSVADANGQYGSQLASGDQFIAVGGKVYLDLATSATQNLLQRFGGYSHVMSQITPQKGTTYFQTAITYDNWTTVTDIYDYGQSYPLRFFILEGLGTPISNYATLSGGLAMTFAVPANIMPYIYIADNPRFYQNKGLVTLMATVIDYALTPAGITLTVPQDILMDTTVYLEIPVKFILPNENQMFSHVSTSYNPSQVLLSAPGTIVDDFPAGSAYFTVKQSYGDTTLQSAGVDFSGLTTNRQYYPKGTTVDFIATVKNALNQPNDLYLTMTVPTNQYNPLETSDNTLPAFVERVTAFSPATTVYYQTAANVTPLDISFMKEQNQSATNFRQYYHSVIMGTWIQDVGGALPSDVVMLVAFTPDVPGGEIVRVDYGVTVQIPANRAGEVYAANTYVNNAVVNYYSSASNMESQSNAVSIQSYSLTAPIPIVKSPSTQQLAGVAGSTAEFSISFDLPTYAADFQSLMLTDQLPQVLFYNYGSATIQIGTGAVQPLNVQFDFSHNVVIATFTDLSSMAGNTITIHFTAAIYNPAKIPTSLHDTNQAVLTINSDPTLTFSSNIVAIDYYYSNVFDLQKQPLYQNNLRINGQPVTFDIYFNVPADVTPFSSMVITDVLPKGLSYDGSNSILQIGIISTQPLKATVSGQTVTADFTNFAAAAGQTVMIHLATILSDVTQLPADNIVQNSAVITLNQIPAYSFPSNSVTAAFGAAPEAIPLSKAPATQAVTALAGTPVLFTLSFTVPQDTFGYGSLTLTDALPAALSYDQANSTLQWGTAAAQPLKATTAGNSVTIELDTLAPYAGKTATITLATTLSDLGAIPAGNQIINKAELMVNHNLALLSVSNDVIVSFSGRPVAIPITKAPAAQAVSAILGMPVLFTLDFTIPQDPTGYDTITITDRLNPVLQYDPLHSTIQIGGGATTALKATVLGQVIGVALDTLAPYGGQTATIVLATTVSDLTQIPSNNQIVNNATLMVNNDATLLAISNNVTVTFTGQSVPMPVTKTPITQTVSATVGAPVSFTVGFALPQSMTGYKTITITDTLDPSLVYNPANSTIRFGANPSRPLNAIVTGNTVVIELDALASYAGNVVIITLATTVGDVSKIPPSNQITNNAQLMVNHSEELVTTSNSVTIIFKSAPPDGPCTQAINELIESVALEEAALANILQAEGAKIQAVAAAQDVTINTLLQVNASVAGMVDAISLLEMILHEKLDVFRETDDEDAAGEDIADKAWSSERQAKCQPDDRATESVAVVTTPE